MRAFLAMSLVAAASLGFESAREQGVQWTTDDAAILRAAIDGVIRPEAARFEHQKASDPILVIDRTAPLCSADTSRPRLMRCLMEEEFGEIGKLATIFKNELPEPARAEIRKSFVARNASKISIPAKSIVGVILNTPEQIQAKYSEETGRGALHATLSMPGLSSDGQAVAFVSYWCGNVCGYGWFVLLKKTPNGWSVVKHEMAWVS